MIPQITEINFPSYATLHQATGSFADMGERTITTQVRIDGDVVPEFDGWELEFKGERFVLPVKEPQAQKNNTTRNSLVDLTFYSWAIYQMKRFFFFETTTTATGTVMADKYQASVRLNLVDFVNLFNRVLNYYFDRKIVADLAPGSYGTEASEIQLNYSYIWDVLQDFYSIFKVRWRIEYDSANDVYRIKIGYPADVINDHDFEYGYEGGLLHFERQVQDDNIKNILLGRGGEKNVPYRYFKEVDPNNPSWAGDPDAVPELANIYFDRIRDLNFRSYIQGWRTNPNGMAGAVDQYDANRATRDWAYAKGYSDTSFDPVEYVKDDESIQKYGERWGALDDNDDIYPTIQGITLSGLGRVDEVVAVSEIVTDDIDALAEDSAIIESLHGVMSQVRSIPGMRTLAAQIRGENFTVPTGQVANIHNNGFFAKAPTPYEEFVNVDIDHSRIRVYDSSTDVEVVSGDAGIPAGTYYYVIDITVVNTANVDIPNVTYGVNGLDLVRSDVSAESWKPTFDIWIKNIWQTTQGENESDEDYALRVWGPILGDHLGNEAKIIFSDGFMAISEDYEFVIASYPVPDQTKIIDSYRSEWKITLYKSGAEYEMSGLYIPNNTSGGKPVAGDHFFFTGIDMPYLYVTLAEERLNAFKTAALDQMKDVNPTWVIHLDKIRINELRNQQAQSLFDRITAGCEMHVRDKRFTGNEILRLFVNTITYTWQEPTDDNPYILPDVEVVVSDHIVVEKSTVEKMQGDLDVLKATYAKMSDMESVIQQVASPMFLRKTGESDTSLSPTKFASTVTSRDFRQGGFGGRGWGLYRDNSSVYQSEAQPTRATRNTRAAEETEENQVDAVLEIDKLVVRKEMHVNNLVVNQITYIGGKQIISAASMECVQVVETNSSYICYFDQKQGSVKNLFLVNDIAMGQIFSPEGVEERYYRMVVTAVDVDNITLSKSGRDGSGAPQKGDVIVQYGNTTNTDRQFVIIRDVIGGGYERMLSGLNSVNATGEEYFFAGYDSTAPAGAKFFVGGSNSNMQFRQSERTLAIKGIISQSQSGEEFVVSVFRGDYDPATTYYYTDEVNTDDGSTYVYINKTTPSTGRTPSDDGVYWKQKRKPGASARLVSLDATSLFFTFDNSESATPTGDQNITLTCKTQNIPNPTYKWDYWGGLDWVPIQNATSSTLTVAYNYAAFGSSNSLRVRVMVNNDPTLYDETTIYKIYGGKDGIEGSESLTAFLTNPSHLYAAGESAAVAGSDTFSVLAFRGVTQLPFDATGGLITPDPQYDSTWGINTSGKWYEYTGDHPASSCILPLVHGHTYRLVAGYYSYYGIIQDQIPSEGAGVKWATNVPYRGRKALTSGYIEFTASENSDYLWFLVKDYYNNRYRDRAPKIYDITDNVSYTIGSITGAPTGMTTSINQTTGAVTVSVNTSLTQAAGELTIPVTFVKENITVNLAYSWALSFTGKEGASAIRLDLNNENDSLLYDAEGNLLSGSVQSVATLYNGDTPVTSGVTYSISERSGCTAAQAGISGSTVTISGINASGYVMVKATYNGHDFFARFSLKKIVGSVKYDLITSPDAIAYNATTGNKSATQINVKIYRTAQNNSGGVTRQAMAVMPSGYTLKVDGTAISGYGTNGYTFNVDFSRASHTITLAKSSVIEDEETVPINVSRNGSDGDGIETQWSQDGATGWHSPYRTGDLYMRQRIGEDGNWGDPIRVVGEDGASGQSSFKSTVFRRVNANSVTAPSGGSYASPFPDPLNDWSDGVPSGAAQLWMSTRIFTSDGQSPQQPYWTTPQPVTDTADIDFEFSAVVSNPGNPTSNPSNWHNTATEDDIWMAVRKAENGVWGTWEISKIKGEQGDTIYTSFVFKASSTKPSAPTGTSPIPSGWDDAPPEGATEETTLVPEYDNIVEDGTYPHSKPIGNNSSTWGKATFYADAGDKVKVTILASSERNYDCGYLSKLDVDNATTILSDYAAKVSGTETATVEYSIETSGEHFFSLGYKKDGTTVSNDDTIYITSVKIVKPVPIWMSSSVVTNGLSDGDWSDPIRVTPEDGKDGKAGKNGAILRGPSMWVEGFDYKDGKNVKYQDVVRGNSGKYYICQISHTSTSSTDPDLSPTISGEPIWGDFAAMEYLATKVLVTPDAFIGDLVVDRLFTNKIVSGQTINPIAIQDNAITITDDSQNVALKITSGNLPTSAPSTSNYSVTTKSTSIQASQGYAVINSTLSPLATINVSTENNTVSIPELIVSASANNNGEFQLYWALYAGDTFIVTGSGAGNIAPRTISLPKGNSQALRLVLSGSLWHPTGESTTLSVSVALRTSGEKVSVAYSSEGTIIASDGAQFRYGYEGIKLTSNGAKVIQDGSEYNLAGIGSRNGLTAPKRIVFCTSYPSSMESDVFYILVST